MIYLLVEAAPEELVLSVPKVEKVRLITASKKTVFQMAKEYARGFLSEVREPTPYRVYQCECIAVTGLDGDVLYVKEPDDLNQTPDSLRSVRDAKEGTG